MVAILSIILTVFGILLSVLLYQLQKKRKYPSRLNYSILECSRVLSTIPEGFNDLSLKLNDALITNNIYYLKLAVFNPRMSDVCADENTGGIKIQLANQSKWVSAQIKSESNNVESGIQPCNDAGDTMILNFSLLKKDEFVIIEALIEAKNFLLYSEDERLSLSHRIPELDKLAYLSSVSKREFDLVKKRIWFKMVYLILCILLLLFQLFIPDRGIVQFKNDMDGKRYSVSVDKDNSIIVTKMWSWPFAKGKTMTVEEFESQYTPDYSYHKTWLRVYNYVLFCVLAVFVGILTIEDVTTINRYKLLKKYE